MATSSRRTKPQGRSASGSVSVNGMRAGAGEGVVIRKKRILRIEALVNAEVVLIVTEDEDD